ncbi:MAG TPA: co-chaperone GroES [Ktedonobacteraceae bacterium]|nr:co-chaperone GroES [Ktedonobacteraceae bacterium]
MAKIRPLGDRVVVKPATREETTRGGIIIPDTAREKPQEGTVVAVGSGRLLDNGTRATLELHEGDRVLFAKYGGTEVIVDNETYLVLKESDVLGIFA